MTSKTFSSTTLYNAEIHDNGNLEIEDGWESVVTILAEDMPDFIGWLLSNYCQPPANAKPLKPCYERFQGYWETMS